MNYSPATCRFFGISTSIASHSNIPSNTLGQVLAIRKSAFIDRKKWDIESYQGSDYEWDEYDDPDAVYIYSHQGEQVTGCVRLRPSSKPTLMTGPLSFILPTANTRRYSSLCWEATRFALSTDKSITRELTRTNVDTRTAALFLSMLKFALEHDIDVYEIVIDTLMEKILKRSGWAAERHNMARGSKGEPIIYATLPCTIETYEGVFRKNTIAEASLYDPFLMTNRSSDTLHKSIDIGQMRRGRNIPAKIHMHTELHL